MRAATPYREQPPPKEPCGKLFSLSFQFSAPRCRLLPDVRASSQIRRNRETDVDLLITKSAGPEGIRKLSGF